MTAPLALVGLFIGAIAAPTVNLACLAFGAAPAVDVGMTASIGAAAGAGIGLAFDFVAAFGR